MQESAGKASADEAVRAGQLLLRLCHQVNLFIASVHSKLNHALIWNSPDQLYRILVGCFFKETI